MTTQILSFALTLAAIVGTVLLVILAPEEAPTYVPYVLALAGLTSTVSAFSKPIKPRGKLPPVALAVIAVALFAACGSSFSGMKTGAVLDPVGESGMRVALTVDGKQICTTEGATSTLDVHAAVAERICAAFPNRCAWEGE